MSTNPVQVSMEGLAYALSSALLSDDIKHAALLFALSAILNTAATLTVVLRLSTCTLLSFPIGWGDCSNVIALVSSL